MRLAIAALARPTFDLEAAATMADAASAAVRRLDPDLRGDATLLTDEDEVAAAAEAWAGAELDALVVVQATFTDTTLVSAAAATTTAPLVLWAAPEPRTGGRLRRNSLCGVNMAAYVLRRDERPFRHLHLPTEHPDAARHLRTAIERGPAVAPAIPPPPTVEASERACAVVDELRSTRIGVIGDRPTGFEPCDFDAARTRAVTGISIEHLPLEELFRTADRADPALVDRTRRELGEQLDLSPLEGEPIEPSVRIHLGLRAMAEAHGWDALATRCWPECFTDYGGAACTAQAALSTACGVPAMCEADAYGAVTALLLGRLAGVDPFVADLVDLDAATDTGAVWHCGLAPLSMADPATPPRGVRHPNRGLPLLNEFALRPGPVTIARLSQSRHRIRLLVGRGELLAAPRPFSGTSGTLRFSRPVDSVLETIVAEGLEHHYGIVHGDVYDDLLGVAGLLELPIVEL